MSMVRGKLEPTIDVVPSKMVIGETVSHQREDGSWSNSENEDVEVETFVIEDQELVKQENHKKVAISVPAL